MPHPVADVIQRAWAFAVARGSIRQGSRQAARFARFGSHSEITFPHTALMGEQRIEIGAHTLVGPLATLSAGMPTTANEPGPPIVTIGDRCLLGKGIGVVGHERVEIGDDLWTGHYVYITDQNHGYADLDMPISRQAMPERPVRIGAGSWLGHGTVVLPGATIGRHVVIGANSVVRGEIPANCVAAGNPARVVKQLAEQPPVVTGNGQFARS